MKRERHTYLTLQTVEAARQGWLDRISAEGRELATERVPLSAAEVNVLYPAMHIPFLVQQGPASAGPAMSFRCLFYPDMSAVAADLSKGSLPA